VGGLSAGPGRALHGLKHNHLPEQCCGIAAQIQTAFEKSKPEEHYQRPHQAASMIIPASFYQPADQACYLKSNHRRSLVAEAVNLKAIHATTGRRN